jgi:hypothetical protein
MGWDDKDSLLLLLLTRSFSMDRFSSDGGADGGK